MAGNPHTHFIIHSFLKKCVSVPVNICCIVKVLYGVVEWLVNVVLVLLLTCISDACYAV